MNEKHDALIKRIELALRLSDSEIVSDVLSDCRAALSQAQAEVARLRQGLWDCYKAAGGDTDGDDTPDALVTDIVEPVLACVTDLRECYNAALSQSEPVRYVPMTDDDALDLLGRCENETEAQVFAVVRDVESEVIRRAIAQGAKLEVQE